VKALKLIDSVWTADERNMFKEHVLTVGDMIPHLMKICKRVQETVHVFKKGQKYTKPKKAGFGLAGTANAMPAKINMDIYVPDWKEGGTIKADRTLEQEAVILRREIKEKYPNKIELSNLLAHNGTSTERSAALNLTMVRPSQGLSVSSNLYATFSPLARRLCATHH
jgi:hypothetical protein